MARLDFSGYVDRVLEQLESEKKSSRAQAREQTNSIKRLSDQVDNLKQAIKETSSPEVRRELMSSLEDSLKQREAALVLSHAPGKRTSLTPQQTTNIKVFLADLRTGWEKLTPEIRRRFIQLILQKVVVHPDSRTLPVKLHWYDTNVTEFTVRRPWGEWRVWSESEDHILRVHYPAAPREELMHLLPGRTWKGIGQRARSLGLRRPKSPEHGGAFVKWTEEEEELLREFYSGNLSMDELCERTGRTVQAAWRRGNLLGLKRPKLGHVPVIWSQPSDVLLVPKREECHPEITLQEKSQTLGEGLPDRS
jgi:hypothetical protein